MADRFGVRLEVPGVRLEFDGSTALWEELVRPAIAPLAEGRWRDGPPVVAPRGPAEPGSGVAAGVSAPVAAAVAPPVASPPPAPVRVAAAPPRPFHVPTAPAPRSATPPPAPRAEASTSRTPQWDPRPLYTALAAEEGRRGEKDAVLLALVSLAVGGRRDVTLAEIMDHIEAMGYPVKGLKAKPILAKFMSRKNFVEPGVLPGTFRATPAAGAHITRRLKELRESR